MITLIQVVTHANVIVDGKECGAIQKGILAFIGLEKEDTQESVMHGLNRIITYRIFPDENGKTNLSLSDIKGGLLLVPQFTLVADTHKGTRPGFSKGMPPTDGKILFEYLVTQAKALYPKIESGIFGADMKVNLCNDGPMTFIFGMSS